MEFKNYKEKQAYYKALAKREKLLWISTPNNFIKDRSKRIIKGSTYVKPKEENHGNDSE